MSKRASCQNPLPASKEVNTNVLWFLRGKQHEHGKVSTLWITAVHCFSHRFELAAADALNATLFAQLDEMLH
jgi:hypothetical protein